MVPFSVLDLAPVRAGGVAQDALRACLAAAQRAEQLGFRRYWVAEHHNMPGIASSATAVLIAHLAAGTKTIRVGSGGVMLPNHVPLVIAEQFGTLAALFPGRIDLGLGRAPGTDPLTARALRRGHPDGVETFPQDVVELLGYFHPAQPGQPVRAVPGAGEDVPVWLLGSSLFSAQLAAHLGLPFAFASHFAPDALDQALRLYRERFRPSAALARPYAMAAVAAYAADTDAEARWLFTSQQQAFLQLRRGHPGPLPPPVDDMNALWSPVEKVMIGAAFREAVVGAPAAIRRGFADFLRRTGVDELMVTAAMFDPSAHLHSLELIAQARDELADAGL